MTKDDSKKIDKKKSNSLFWMAGGLLALTLGLPVFFNFKGYVGPQVIATLPVDTQCDLHSSACTTKLPQGGNISLSIEPRSIPLLKPLQLHVTTKGVDASKVEIDFVGVGMNMGYNRPSLKKTKTEHFVGETTLPVCVRRKMDWEAQVLIHTPKGIVKVPFQFYTLR
jgi:hypothetical protein